MAYKVSFPSGREETFESLDSEAASRIEQKLEEVSSCPYRSPTDWSYSSWSGQSEGVFRWGSYRVFADVDEAAERIVVREARYRENLYR